MTCNRNTGTLVVRGILLQGPRRPIKTSLFLIKSPTRLKSVVSLPVNGGLGVILSPCEGRPKTKREKTEQYPSLMDYTLFFPYVIPTNVHSKNIYPPYGRKYFDWRMSLNYLKFYPFL